MGSPPRIAFFDIENAPSLGYYYEPYLKHGGRNIIHTVEPWYMLSYAWKWLGEKTIHCNALCDYPEYEKDKKDDSALVKDLWNLFDEADILIAHNGDKFDIRKANARFLELVGRPPSPYKTIDTLKIARRHFYLESNRLGDLGVFLGLGDKVPTTGKDTWLRCMAGDMGAWKRIMKPYNKRDVDLLEKVYDRLKCWHPSHPDLRPYNCQESCPTCGSHDIHYRGEHVTKAGRKPRIQCQACGAWSIGKKAA